MGKGTQVLLDKPTMWEKGDMLYIVAPLTPVVPESAEVQEFAFAQELQRMAPNGNLMWLRGQYVEADIPNRNGQVWTSDELSIKSLTPMLMPVTVMHDERTAVGTIADARLVLPSEVATISRARIDTTLALWKHRFPEICEEAQFNYEQGCLMQSMECHAPQYSCGECGQIYQKLPGGAEQEKWCAHLSESSGPPARILGNVVFTGTGLIFGTRGAEGADSKAHLEVFQEEVAEFHERSHRDSGKSKTRNQKPRRKRTSMDPIEISREEYAELQRRPKPDELAKANTERDEAIAERDEAVSAKEAAEIAQKKAEDERDEAKKALTEAEEQANAAKLSEERMSKLGKGFLDKLPESIKDRLPEQAKSLKDEDWSARVTELAELTGVKPDEGAKPGDEKDEKGETFTKDEVANSQFGSGGSNGDTPNEPSEAERGSVMRGLVGSKK